MLKCLRIRSIELLLRSINDNLFVFGTIYQCIMGTGTVDILSNDSEKTYGLQRIMDHYTEKTHWEFNPKYVDMIQVLKLSVRTWSCKEH